MSPLLIILIVILLFGGLGYGGFRGGYFANAGTPLYGGGIVALLVIVLIVLLLMGRL